MGKLSIAVIGSGISGLGAAWLLSQRHDVTLFEREPRPGGHSNTVDVEAESGPVPVDTGFIVYNTASYPNLIALFQHLGVETAPTSMSFAVSLDRGRYEYSGSGPISLFGQPSNIVNTAHWRMILDALRFFREARGIASDDADGATLGEYLTANGYSNAFIERHILPMAAAIWSTPSADVMSFPAASFARFFDSHGLLQVIGRPQWRTVVGGSRAYVRKVLDATAGRVSLGTPVRKVERKGNGALLTTTGGTQPFDAVVMAVHADDALGLLGDCDVHERRLLGAFRYVANRAVLHKDAGFMPKRRRLWASWNYLANGDDRHKDLSVTYWMNSLQPIGDGAGDLFVTLNPGREITDRNVIASIEYRHPMFDRQAMSAQRELWALQGRRRTWFCGSYFGYGFHEDGLQSGLAAAEDIGGVRRPWMVLGESDRIHMAHKPLPAAKLDEAAE